MGKEKIINVYCRNGHLLFERYHKVGDGRLQKCYKDEIGVDHTNASSLSIGELIYCVRCDPMIPVALVGLVHGRAAYVIKQAGIRKVTT